MPQPNLKIYLALSAILAVILIVILVIPLSRRGQNLNNQTGNLPTPTTAASNNQSTGQSSTPVQTKEFTGVDEEALPQEIADQSAQKQDLRYKTPASFSTFSIDFDYAEDKFKIVLNEPKETALREFEEWKKSNYSAIPMDQFIFN